MNVVVSVDRSEVYFDVDTVDAVYMSVGWYAPDCCCASAVGIVVEVVVSSCVLDFW